MENCTWQLLPLFLYHHLAFWWISQEYFVVMDRTVLHFLLQSLKDRLDDPRHTSYQLSDIHQWDTEIQLVKDFPAKMQKVQYSNQCILQGQVVGSAFFEGERLGLVVFLPLHPHMPSTTISLVSQKLCTGEFIFLTESPFALWESSTPSSLKFKESDFFPLLQLTSVYNWHPLTLVGVAPSLYLDFPQCLLSPHRKENRNLFIMLAIIIWSTKRLGQNLFNLFYITFN